MPITKASSRPRTSDIATEHEGVELRPSSKRSSTPSEPKRASGVSPPKQKRPGGRTERNRKLVGAAVLELIQNGNLDFEIQDVTALSGVHRTTIFRRWPDRAALMAEGFTEHVSRFSLQPSGDWKKDIGRFASALQDFFNDPVELAMNRTLMTSDNAMFRAQMIESWSPIMYTFRDILIKAKIRKEIGASIDPDIVVIMTLAPLLLDTLFGRDLSGAFVDFGNRAEKLVSHVIALCEQAEVTPQGTG